MMNGELPCGIVILAAGLGKRMRSEKAKVLHEVGGRAMAAHVADIATKIAGEEVVVVVGHQAERVRRAVSDAVAPKISFALQQRQLGTGHAVSCALPYLGPGVEEVVILYGDVPLLREETIRKLVDAHSSAGRELTVLAFELADPAGYGRILTDKDGGLLGIVEDADASADQKKIRMINSGIYCVKRNFLADALPLLSAENVQGEYYLTDIVSIGYRQGKRMGVMTADDADEVTGVNSLEELEKVRRIFHRRRPA